MTPLLLPQQQRVKKKSHFNYIFSNRKRISSKSFLLYFAKVRSDKQSVAFVASKKNVGNAVLRNICKRRLKECYRQNQNYIATDQDLIWVAKKELVHIHTPQLIHEVKTVLQRNDLWKD